MSGNAISPRSEATPGPGWIRHRDDRWLREKVRRDLLNWNFNSIGWVQDTATTPRQFLLSF